MITSWSLIFYVRYHSQQCSPILNRIRTTQGPARQKPLNLLRSPATASLGSTGRMHAPEHESSWLSWPEYSVNELLAKSLRQQACYVLHANNEPWQPTSNFTRQLLEGWLHFWIGPESTFEQIQHTRSSEVQSTNAVKPPWVPSSVLSGALVSWKVKTNGIHSKQLLPAKGLESLPKFITPNPTNPPKLLLEIFVPLGSKSLVTKIDQGPFKLRTNSWPLILSLSHRSALTIVWQRDQHQDQTSSHCFSSISRPSGISRNTYLLKDTEGICPVAPYPILPLSAAGSKLRAVVLLSFQGQSAVSHREIKTGKTEMVPMFPMVHTWISLSSLSISFRSVLFCSHV